MFFKSNIISSFICSFYRKKSAVCSRSWLADVSNSHFDIYLNLLRYKNTHLMFGMLLYAKLVCSKKNCTFKKFTRLLPCWELMRVVCGWAHGLMLKPVLAHLYLYWAGDCRWITELSIKARNKGKKLARLCTKVTKCLYLLVFLSSPAETPLRPAQNIKPCKTTNWHFSSDLTNKIYCVH